MSSQARNLFLALAAAVLPVACRVSPKPPLGFDNDSLVIGRLAEVNPRDIVVVPVANATGRADLPLDQLRRAFQAGLVVRRYTPLDLDYVDSEIVEAAYELGTLQEQAVLQITITGWDDSAWRSHSRLEIQADVHLLDAGPGGSGEALWGGPVARVIDLDLDPNAVVNQQRRLERAVERFAELVLASLPARDPRPTRG